MACAICEERKEKRFCPAVHGKICAQCCGEQREVTLDCPSECPYLQQSRLQARDHVSYGGAPDRPDDRYRQALFLELEIPEVEIPEQFLYEREELIVGLTFALAKCARADRELRDRDLLAAVSAMARSYQTLVNSSLIYEPPTANMAHHAIAREINVMVKEFREAETRHLGQVRLSDSAVLNALIFLLRLGVTRTSGRPKSRAFIDFILTQFSEKPGSIASPEEASSRIVIP